MCDRKARAARSGNRALRLELGHQRRLGVENRLVVHFLHVDERGEPLRPAAVVVRHERGVRIDLLSQQRPREPSIRLIGLHDERASRVRLRADLELGRRAPDFDALHPQDPDERLELGHVTVRQQHERERRIGLAHVDRVLGLAIEVLDDEVRERRGQLERREDAGLHVVRVVAARERPGRAWGHGESLVPLPRVRVGRASAKSAWRAGRHARSPARSSRTALKLLDGRRCLLCASAAQFPSISSRPGSTCARASRAAAAPAASASATAATPAAATCSSRPASSRSTAGTGSSASGSRRPGRWGSGSGLRCATGSASATAPAAINA